MGRTCWIYKSWIKLRWGDWFQNLKLKCHISSHITLCFVNIALHTSPRNLIENTLPTISGNSDKIEPVEQDPRTDQLEPCKSIALGPSSGILDLLGNLLRAAKNRDITLNKKNLNTLKSKPRPNDHGDWSLYQLHNTEYKFNHLSLVPNA